MKSEGYEYLAVFGAVIGGRGALVLEAEKLMKQCGIDFINRCRNCPAMREIFRIRGVCS